MSFPTLMIQPVGEPGSGKTTLSFWLSQALKHENIRTEFVPEVVKYECFTPQGQSRVRSGRFDLRYLAQQARWVKPLLGQVEVLVNDGCFELFPFYAQRRMEPSALATLRRQVEVCRTWPVTPAWFVMPERDHAYDTLGRNETEEEAAGLRQSMQEYLNQEYDVTPRLIRGPKERERLLRDIVDYVARARQASA